MAPELSLGRPYNSSVDMFAFGILAFIVLTGNFRPYLRDTADIHSTPVNVQMVVAANPDFRPKIGASIIKEEWMQRLLKDCWADDPSERPTFQMIIDMLKHEKDQKRANGDETILPNQHFDNSKKIVEEKVGDEEYWKEKYEQNLEELEKLKRMNEKVVNRLMREKEEQKRVIDELRRNVGSGQNQELVERA